MIRWMTICIALALSVAFVGCNKDGDGPMSHSPSKKNSDTSDADEPEGDEPSGPVNPMIELVVANRGKIMIELFEDQTPNTVKNFVFLCDQKALDRNAFHRVIPGFVAQGGGMSAGDTWRWTIKNDGIESTYERDGLNRNLTGTIAMARTFDIHSGANQFYINLVDNIGPEPQRTNLDKNPREPYCVFGRVVEGMEVVHSIKQNDVITSARCTQRREDTKYVPLVKYNGETTYREADPLK